MRAPRVYLDHNASSPLRPEARAAVIAALELAGNPSSVHGEGRSARAVIEAAREDVAALVGARIEDVVFTSGGSEAANTVVRSGFDVIAMAGIEHDSVREAALASGARIVELAVDGNGLIDGDHMDRSLAELGAERGRVLVCLQLANNETGVIQPVAGLAARARSHGAVVLTDAVQAAGKVPVSFADLGVDAMVVSAHKLGGPKGVGAIVAGPAVRLVPLVRGGGQERRRRAGTENVAGIAGFGATARAARSSLDRMVALGGMRNRLEREILAATPGVRMIGAGAGRLPNTSCLAMPGRAAETQVIRFDLAGFSVSSGAACSSGKVGRSQVLAAMGLGPDAASAVRVSLGWSTTDDEITRFVAAWTEIHAGSAERSVA